MGPRDQVMSFVAGLPGFKLIFPCLSFPVCSGGSQQRAPPRAGVGLAGGAQVQPLLGAGSGARSGGCGGGRGAQTRVSLRLQAPHSEKAPEV